MPDNTPRLYFLRGDDPARFKQVLGSFRTSMGDVDLADLNTTRLDGDSLWTLEALFSDAMTVPFLAPRRMVIVEKARDFLGRLNPDQQARMLSLLGDLPQTTALVLLVEQQHLLECLSALNRCQQKPSPRSPRYHPALRWCRACWQ